MGGNGVSSAVNSLIQAYSAFSGTPNSISRVVVLQNIYKHTRNGMTSAQALSALAQQMALQGVNVPANLLPQNATQNNNQNQTQSTTANITTPNQSVANYQKMSDKEVSTYIKGLEKNVSMPYNLAKTDTQRLIYDLGLNEKPQVVSSKDFDKINGTVYYRGISANQDTNGVIIDTAFDVANKTLLGKNTSIGAGMHGDGFYFTSDRSYAQSYAHSGNSGKNLNESAILRMKIDTSKARIVEYDTLETMFLQENSTVRSAFRNMKTFAKYNNEEMSAYAIYKGYNVIKVSRRNFMIPLDRSTMIIDENYKVR